MVFDIYLHKYVDDKKSAAFLLMMDNLCSAEAGRCDKMSNYYK
jgi:hypothetical protein